MIISKILQRNFKISKYNKSKMHQILNLVRDKIVAQGQGCFIPGQGVSMCNRANITFDPIGILLGAAAVKGYWHEISAEESKPLRNKIFTKYQINITRDSERANFVNFLQDLQDAHDEAFDEFNTNCPSMDTFIAGCEVIVKKYKL
jgi:hypothetical protein